MQLALGAAVIWLLIGIPIGILAALRPRSLLDRTAMTLALIGISAPVFFLGPLALYVFWFKLKLAPRYRLLPDEPVRFRDRGSATGSSRGPCSLSCTRRSTRG